jgi:sugar fermentation stimulation protein A
MLEERLLPFPYALHPAIFWERPNRFISVLEIPSLCGAERVKAHVPDPGRLKELLIPGVKVLARDYGENAKRKLRYSLEMVLADSGSWVSVNTQLPNQWVAQMLERQWLPGFEGFHVYKKEFTYGESRLDFLLHQKNRKPCLLEVKSCSLVESAISSDGQSIRVAQFPDAPSIRATRHVDELVAALQSGEYESRIVLMIQREDADVFTPKASTDPKFAQALKRAIDVGVIVQAFCVAMLPLGYQFVKEVPVVCDLVFSPVPCPTVKEGVLG